MITEKMLAALRPTEERQTIREKGSNLGVRVEAKERGGRISFFWQAKHGGKSIFKALGEFPTTTVKEARALAAVWKVKGDEWRKVNFDPAKNPFTEPKPQSGEVPTFKQLTEAYITRHLRKEASDRAEYDTRILLKNHFSNWLPRPIDAITTHDVNAAMNAAEGKYIRNSIAEFARRIFAWSTREGFWKLASNPAQDIKREKTKPRKRYLLPDELLRFNDELKKEKNEDTADVLALLLATGARKSNVYEMRWEDISLTLRAWAIPKSKCREEGYTVPLEPRAMEVLERRHEAAGEPARGFVFASGRSKSGHIDDIKKQWMAFRTRAGIPDVRLHDLRRTKGSYAAMSGQSLEQIAKVLGHTSVSATEIYSQISAESARAASAAADSFMDAAMARERERQKQQPIALAEPKRKRLPASA